MRKAIRAFDAFYRELHRVFTLSIAGCTLTVYVPLESHTTSTLDREHIAARVDTVIDRDTVTLTVSVAGDTVIWGSHPMARTDPSDCGTQS